MARTYRKIPGDISQRRTPRSRDQEYLRVRLYGEGCSCAYYDRSSKFSKLHCDGHLLWSCARHLAKVRAGLEPSVCTGIKASDRDYPEPMGPKNKREVRRYFHKVKRQRAKKETEKVYQDSLSRRPIIMPVIEEEW